MNSKHTTVIFLIAGVTFVLVWVGFGAKVNPTTQRLSNATTTDAGVEEWVTYQNIKYKYSVKRPQATEITLMGSNLPVAEVEKIAFVQLGRPVGYLSVYAVDATRDTEEMRRAENQHTVDTLLRKAYDSNLDMFVSNYRERLLHDVSGDFEKVLSEVTDVELAGKQGKVFTYAVTYLGDETLDYPPTGVPTPYLFFEHNGVMLVIIYNLEENWGQDPFLLYSTYG